MARQGRPPTPCPRCGKGKREYQVIVQGRPVGPAVKGQPSNSATATVCASCAGQLRAKLTMLLEREVS